VGVGNGLILGRPRPLFSGSSGAAAFFFLLSGGFTPKGPAKSTPTSTHGFFRRGALRQRRHLLLHERLSGDLAFDAFAYHRSDGGSSRHDPIAGAKMSQQPLGSGV
jgi:hypothetical protein